MAEEVRLADLMKTITERLKDAIKDVEGAAACIEKHSTDPKAATSCVLDVLRTPTEKKFFGE